MARSPFVQRPQPAVETDFGDLAELGVFLLPFDLAGELAIQAALASRSTRTIDAFQPNFCAGLYPRIEQNGALDSLDFLEVARKPLPAHF